MPTDIKAYRVFIASPGGLQAERNAFREALARYNEMDGLSRGVMFLPVGWEDTLGGSGRPQHIINQDLRECDFMVLLLWDRWGSPPDRESRFRSGVEEEFHVALECLQNSTRPMQEIVVLFKSVHEKQLSDPGPQLNAVLDFRKSLEESKEHLFHSFDEVRSFENLLLRHLASWVRAHEEGQWPTVRPTLIAPQTVMDDTIDRFVEMVAPQPSSTSSNLVANALQLAKLGKRTDAEALFARGVVRGADPDIFFEYGRFLKSDGRLAQSAELYRRAIELAKKSGNEAVIMKSLIALGNVLYTRGSPGAAEQMYRNALEIGLRLGSQEGVAIAYGSLGNVLYARGDLAGAEKMLNRALEINERLGRFLGVAAVYLSLGNLLTFRGNLGQAEHLLRMALEINERYRQQAGVAETYTSLGGLLDTRGDTDGAEQVFRKALAINERLGRLEGMAKVFGNLGNILRTRGDLDGAEEMLRKALDLNKHLGRLEGIAKCFGNLGTVFRMRGELGRAEQMHRRALAINERLEQWAGVADTYGNLGIVLYSRGDIGGAEQMHRKALEINERLDRLKGMAKSQAQIGSVLDAQGDDRGARHAFLKAAELYNRIGAAHSAEQVLALMAKATDEGEHADT